VSAAVQTAAYLALDPPGKYFVPEQFSFPSSYTSFTQIIVGFVSKYCEKKAVILWASFCLRCRRGYAASLRIDRNYTGGVYMTHGKSEEKEEAEEKKESNTDGQTSKG
jgi:hypothetical protein